MSDERPDPVHLAIAKLEGEMLTLFETADISADRRMVLEQRLRDLKEKAGVGN